jgi:hypothetical protein
VLSAKRKNEVEPTSSGGVYLGLREWTRSIHGAEGLDRVRGLLAPAAREVFDARSIVSTSRVPAFAFRALGEAMVQCFGLEGQSGFYTACGAVAVSDLSTSMKVLMLLGTPSFVAQRFPRAWSHYFSDGKLEMGACTSDGAEFTLTGAEIYGEPALLGTVGWVRAALVYAGAKRVTVQRTRERPDVHRYRMGWA